MNTQDFMNLVYDLIAQNEVSQQEKDEITEFVDHVDTDRNAIVFKTDSDYEFELQLVDTYAPSKGGTR